VSVAAQAVEGSIVTGAMYGLVGAGFALLFRASKVLSFTQGGFMLLGAFIFYSLAQDRSRPFLISVLITMLVVGVFSALVYVIVFARVAARQAFATSVATIGLSGVLGAGVAIKYGTAPLTLPNVVSARAYQVLGATVSTSDIVSVAMAVVVVVAALLLLRLTPLGLRMKAVADSATLSEHLGVSASRLSAVAWGLAGATAAIAGISYSMGSAVDPVGVANVGLMAFPAIILGGLDSVGGALLGGFVLAGVQNAVQVLLTPGWVDIVSFSLMLVILFFRPSGLFGSSEAVRL